MSDQKSASSGVILAGDLFFAIEQADGSFVKYYQVEVDKLTITTPSDTKQRISKGRTTYGQSVTTFPVPKPAEFLINFSQITRAVFAMQLSGLLAPVAIASSVFAALPVVAALDAWVETGRENLTNDTVVKNSAGTTTYVLGTDYKINPRLGMLYAIPGGAITDLQSLKLTGAEAAVSGERITGASKYRHVLRIRLDGINLVDGQNVQMRADRAVLTSDQAYDFLQADLAEVPLKGQMEIPGAGLAPFTVDYLTET